MPAHTALTCAGAASDVSTVCDLDSDATAIPAGAIGWRTPAARSFVSNDTIADCKTTPPTDRPTDMHVQPAQRGAPSGGGSSTESAVPPTAAPPEMPGELVDAHPEGPRQPGSRQWSGSVRCGINGTECARRAVWHTMHTIISRFGGVLPVEVVRSILMRTRAALSPIASFFLPGREDGEPGSGEATGRAPCTKGGAIVQAATGVLAMVARTCDYLSQHAVLSSVVRLCSHVSCMHFTQHAQHAQDSRTTRSTLKDPTLVSA